MIIKGIATLEQLKERSGDWLTVKDLARELEVHPDTIRRWERKGRISCLRHPVNNYRLFLWSEVVQGVLDNEKRCSPLRACVVQRAGA